MAELYKEKTLRDRLEYTLSFNKRIQSGVLALLDNIYAVMDRKDSVITETTTVSNTTTETTIFTGSITPGTLKEGQVIKVTINGILSNASASDDITIRKYIGNTLLETFNPAMGNVTNAPWEVINNMTVRSIGANGELVFHGSMEIDGNKSGVVNSTETIDTTVDEDITITVQWDNAAEGNQISILQGFLEILG